MSKYKPFKKQTLAEQLAARIEESIVNGDVQGGEMLPTEPEMTEQFGVSRAVVRDATRMLAAKGLIEIQHGKGSFVTHTQREAFGQALLLALQRMGASNWDVAQFEQVIYPEVIALAAQHATQDDINQIQAAADVYLAMHAQIADKGLPPASSSEFAQFRQRWTDFVQAVFDATHNKVLSLLAHPLIQLHGAREWTGLPEGITTQETRLIMEIIELIKGSDPTSAREKMRALMDLPPEAVQALKKTDVATLTTIAWEGE